MRIEKMLSNLGYGSRKEIKKLIKEKAIQVNGQVITDIGFDVNPCDKVVIFDEEAYYNDNLTILLHKPSGFISSNIDEEYESVIKLLEEKYQRQNLKVAGRLDMDSTGMLLLSNNGDLIHKIISPKSNVNKTYLVELEHDLTEEEKMILSSSMALKDAKGEFYITQAKGVKKVDDRHILITIDEGKFHQVKRMVAYAKNEVIKLKRIQIGGLELGDLEEGQYRILGEDDIEKIFQSEEK